MERQFISWLCDRFAHQRHLRLGPGDDAAVVELASSECVVSVDLISDGVDFRLGEIDPRRIGRKALAVSLSDLAAMAATPVAAVVAIAAPHNVELEVLKQITEGIAALAAQYDVAIAGGDTNAYDGPLAISVTAIGRPGRAGVLKRSGACAGDTIVVTGAFGGSIAGKHLDFEPRVAEAQWLSEHGARAAIDVSDGLSLDLSRLAKASGCGAAIDLSLMPVADAARQLESKGGASALERALGDGEDFELIVALPPEAAAALPGGWPYDTPLTTIGEFVPQPGLWQKTPDGRLEPLAARGFEHHFGKGAGSK